MKVWQVDIIFERNELEIKIKRHFNSLADDNLFEISKWLDKEIAAWQE